MRVDNLRVPLVMPYITSGVNDLLYFRVGNAFNAATLSVGSYNGFTLAAMIQTRLTAAYTGGIRSDSPSGGQAQKKLKL